MRATVSQSTIESIITADHPDPFQVLGQHPVEIDGIPSWSVRAFQPQTRAITLIDAHGDVEIPMLRCHDAGFFEITFIGRKTPLSYRLRVENYRGECREFHDAYAHLPSLTAEDLSLFLQGQNFKIYEVLGAHPLRHQGVDGIRFALWAPAARAVSVIGTFNQWDRRRHPMRLLGASGVWELFIPGLKVGEYYKFQVKTAQGLLVDKTDPFALRCELAPNTASIVHELGDYDWQDQAWMQSRADQNLRESPLFIYELHIGSWLREPQDSEEPPNFRQLAPRIVTYVKSMGYTHIELLPVTEHPFGGSWGYQTTGYYAPTSRWGSPEDLMYLVDLCHQNKIGVILDWVPGHFPKDISALGRFDGTALFEHLDPRLGEHPDWGTFIFNYGRNEVRNFLMGSALFWLEHYHIDGIRIDAVSSMLYLDYNRKPGEWVPNRLGGRENLDAIRFLKELNVEIQSRFPGVFTAAEESTSWPKVTQSVDDGGLGFTFKWNLGWMNDILRYLGTDPLYRSQQQDKLTFSIWYAFSEHFILPLSHDEVVHLKRSLLEKMPGDDWQKFANLRLLFCFLLAHPGKKLLFMGGDLAQRSEWNHDIGLPWRNLQDQNHDRLNRFTAHLTHFYQQEPALYEVDASSDGFEWLDFSDAARSVIAFKRKGKKKGEFLIWIFNFTPVVRHQYRVGVDIPGIYTSILNSDATAFGGSGVENAETIQSQPGRWHDRDHSIHLTLPPLAAVVLRCIKADSIAEKSAADAILGLLSEDKNPAQGDKSDEKEPAQPSGKAPVADTQAEDPADGDKKPAKGQKRAAKTLKEATKAAAKQKAAAKSTRKPRSAAKSASKPKKAAKSATKSARKSKSATKTASKSKKAAKSARKAIKTAKSAQKSKKSPLKEGSTAAPKGKKTLKAAKKAKKTPKAAEKLKK